MRKTRITRRRSSPEPKPVPVLQPEPVSDIPISYRPLCTMLGQQLADFNAAITGDGTGSPLFGAELIPADNYKQLPSNEYYAKAIIPYLDQLSALGCRCVKFQLGFPVLYEPFWSGWVVPHVYGANHFTTMRAQYARLVADVHSRGMRVIAQSQHMELGRGSTWNVAGYYGTLDWAGYKAGRLANVLEVARSLGLSSTDFLIVQSEPDNEAQMTSRSELMSVQSSVGMIANFLDALSAQGLNKMSVGAGCGSWYPRYREHAQALCGLPLLDLLDIHVYPVNLAAQGTSFARRAIELADIAMVMGKKCGTSEAWLQKVADAELGVIASEAAFARSVYGFFAPLDQEFLHAMVRLARWKGFQFVSASMSRQLFGYVDHDVNPSGSPAELDALENAAVLAALGAGTFSETGTRYKELIT